VLIPGVLYAMLLSVLLFLSLLGSPVSFVMVSAHCMMWMLLFSPCALMGVHIFRAFPLLVLRCAALEPVTEPCDKHDICLVRIRRVHAVERVPAASITSVRARRDASRIWNVSLELADETEMLVAVTHMRCIALRMKAHLREMTSSDCRRSASGDSRDPNGK